MHSVENPPLHLQPVCGGNWVYGCDCDFVAELAKRSRQHLSAFLLGLGIRFAALLDKSHPLVQYLPNHAAEPMSDNPDGGLIAQPRQQTPEHRLKITAILLHRSVRRLVQHSPQIFVAFGRATAVVFLRAFLLAGTGSHPRGQVCRRIQRSLGSSTVALFPLLHGHGRERLDPAGTGTLVVIGRRHYILTAAHVPICRTFSPAGLIPGNPPKVVSLRRRLTFYKTYLPHQSSEFLKGGDAWVIAHAMHDKDAGVVVTQESLRKFKSKIKLPTICKAMEVKYINTYDLLDVLDFKLENYRHK
jgi:Domain of unknown function (DUF4411)